MGIEVLVSGGLANFSPLDPTIKIPLPLNGAINWELCPQHMSIWGTSQI